MSNSKILPYFEAGFAATVWGASFIATKIALEDISPITIVWLRFLMGVLILGIAVILRKQFTVPKQKEWIYFSLLGFLFKIFGSCEGDDPAFCTDGAVKMIDHALVLDDPGLVGV